jgi:hypothetical protein
MLSASRSQWWTILSELLLFAALSLCWLPRPSEWTTAVPQGREDVATVPLFNAWTIAWNVGRARDGWRGYWQAPMFHPASFAFATCEAQPLTALLAPLETAGGLALAYNVYLAAMLTLNGWMTSRWLTGLGLRLPARLFGGLAVQTLPFVHWQFGVLQLVPVWGILWTWSAVWRYAEQPGWRPALSAGLGFGCTYWLCNYYGLFLSLLLAAGAPALCRWKLFTWRLPVHIAGTGLIAGALIAPIVRMQLQADRQVNFTRLLITIQELSLQPQDLANAPVRRIPSIALQRWFEDAARPTWMEGMGTLAYGLAILGAIVGLCRSSQRRATLWLLAVGLAALLLALGPNGSGGLRVYSWLLTWLPGLDKVRSPFRFVVFLQLAVASLGAFAVHNLWPGREQLSSNWLRRLRWGVVTIAAAATLYETWPARSYACSLPDLDRHAVWHGWIMQNLEPRTPIVCLPFTPGTSVEDHFINVVWMLHGTRHHAALCNGYAAYFPQTFRSLRDDLTTFPSRSSLQSVATLGVRTLVIRRDAWKPELGDARSQAAQAGLQWLFTDEDADIDIWRLPEPQTASP